jgi:hypothetical protein
VDEITAEINEIENGANAIDDIMTTNRLYWRLISSYQFFNFNFLNNSFTKLFF